MRRPYKWFRTTLSFIIVLLLLAGCNFPLSISAQPASTEAPTADVTATEAVTATEEVAVFEEPLAAQTMIWTDSSTVVFVPGGEFTMGHTETTPTDYQPEHTVTLDAFWIYQAEVTNAMYANCVALGACSAPDTTQNEWYTNPEFVNSPVTGVTWAEAQAYCEWVDARLPTEAEWELAGRGTDGDTYPWGEDEPTCSLLNFEDCWDPNEPEVVRSYVEGASPYNLADMAGNAAEWVYDWYGEDYYASSPAASPVGPDTGTERVVRGSSFFTPADELQIYLRHSIDPLESRSDLGFRCVLTGEVVSQPVLPMCQAISYSPTWHDITVWPQQDIPAPGASLETYCNLDGLGNQYGTAGITLDPGVEAGQVFVDSPNGDIACIQDNVNFQLYNCYGSAIQPGTNLTARVCPVSQPAQSFYTPVCPIFYQFDDTIHMCVYHLPGLPVTCVAPNVVVPGYGCQPAPDTLGQCPVGYYSATYNGSPVCIPAAGPHICQPGQYCAAVCPQGLTFNEASLCCDAPADVPPSCPTGYTMDETNWLCMPDDPVHQDCNVLIDAVPTCAPAQQVGCWITSGGITTVAVTTCVYPCPAAVGNGGPCTP